MYKYKYKYTILTLYTSYYSVYTKQQKDTTLWNGKKTTFLSTAIPNTRLLQYVLDKDKTAHSRGGRVKQGFPFSNIEPCVFAVGMMSPTPTCGICQVQRCHLTFEIVQLLSFMFCIYLKGLLVTSCYPWWKYIEQWNLSCMGLFAAVCYWVQGKHKYKYNTNNNINSNNSNSNTNSNTQIQTQTQTQTQMVCRYVLPGS